MQSELLANYQLLARYNRWFNERLYDACARLDDSERKRDRKAFFGSVHGTLSHLLWADSHWLGRFSSITPVRSAAAVVRLQPQANYLTVLHEDWADLRRARSALDEALIEWLADMPPDALQRQLEYLSVKGQPREQPLWQALTHFFNHQTHHRGQVTTLLCQSGVDPGPTDLIAMLN